MLVNLIIISGVYMSEKVDIENLKAPVDFWVLRQLTLDLTESVNGLKEEIALLKEESEKSTQAKWETRFLLGFALVIAYAVISTSINQIPVDTIKQLMTARCN